jgi:hypothetical protein
MTHNLGRVVTVNQNISDSIGLDFVPSPGPHGGPRFVILHFDSVNLHGSARLTVNLVEHTQLGEQLADPSCTT